MQTPITLVFVEPRGTARCMAGLPIGSLMRAARAHRIVGAKAESRGNLPVRNLSRFGGFDLFSFARASQRSSLTT
jgi:hypothetical protein